MELYFLLFRIKISTFLIIWNLISFVSVSVVHQSRKPPTPSFKSFCPNSTSKSKSNFRFENLFFQIEKLQKRIVIIPVCWHINIRNTNQLSWAINYKITWFSMTFPMFIFKYILEFWTSQFWDFWGILVNILWTKRAGVKLAFYHPVKVVKKQNI